MASEVSLSNSLETATGSYHESVESNHTW